jgi:hypothetical protein
MNDRSPVFNGTGRDQMAKKNALQMQGGKSLSGFLIILQRWFLMGLDLFFGSWIFFGFRM